MIYIYIESLTLLDISSEIEIKNAEIPELAAAKKLMREMNLWQNRQINATDMVRDYTEARA